MLEAHTTTGDPGYRFGEFRLELGKRRLIGPEGAASLSGRAFDVVAYLVQHRGRVVGKDELIKAVWPHTVVEDNNLNQAISTLRRALGDSRDAPRYIVTVAGRGYQFIGDAAPLADDAIEPAVALVPSNPALPARARVPEIEPSSFDTGQASSAQPDVARRALIAGVAAAAIVAAGAGFWRMRSQARAHASKSIAILPFRPLVPEARNAAMELGVTEQLINRLSRVPGLVVAPLSSVMPLSARDADPLETGRRLHVDAVVDGHLQIHDDRVRLTARLLAIDGGASLWANTYTEPLGDLLAVQDSLAVQIADALSMTLSDETRSRVLARSTSDVEAWQLYASARLQVERREAASVLRAIPLFEAALQRDPRFALAAAGLSDAHAVAGVFGAVPPAMAWEKAREVALHALALDAALPAAHVALGHVVTQYDRDLEAGRRHYARALQLDPDFAQAMAWMALNRIQAAELSRAAQFVRDAQAREPASLTFIAQAGWVRYFQRDYDAAARDLSRVVDAVPAAPLPRQFLAHALLATRKGAEVVRLLEGRNELAPCAFSNLGRAYAQVGNAAAARKEIERVETLGTQGFGVGFDLALMRLELGDRDRAITALERGIDDHSSMQCYVNVEPALDPLRGDSRFRSIGKRLGLA